MNLLTPQEIAENLGNIGANKGKLSLLKMILLGIAAGAFIAFGGLAALTASSGWADWFSQVKVISLPSVWAMTWPSRSVRSSTTPASFSRDRGTSWGWP